MVQISLSWILNFANCIVGVGLLAMPYCYQECGIILATLMVSVSAYLTKVTCDFLLRAGSYTRKSTYEQIALHVYGPTGKLICEISTIGIMLGTLVAFQVVIGDLSPAVAENWLGFEKTWSLRAVLMIVACSLVLPIALMRNVSSLANLNAFSMTFYVCFISVVVFLSLPIIYAMEWWAEVHFWRMEGVAKCLPIILLAFNCQAQVFIFYSALPDPNAKTMMAIVNQSINLVNLFYVTVGTFGYIAFYKSNLLGDVLENFPESFLTNLMKLGFLLSVVISFPLMIFPLRSSINSLFFANKRQGILHDVISSTADYIAPEKFVLITVGIVSGTLVVGILVPKIEVVLSITGSLAGSFISFVYPSALFLKAGAKDQMRKFGLMVLLISSLVMIACTSSSLSGLVAGAPAPVKVEDIQKISRNPANDIGIKDLPHTTIAKVGMSNMQEVKNAIDDEIKVPTERVNFAGLSNTIKYIGENKLAVESIDTKNISPMNANVKKDGIDIETNEKKDEEAVKQAAKIDVKRSAPDISSLNSDDKTIHAVEEKSSAQKAEVVLQKSHDIKKAKEEVVAPIKRNTPVELKKKDSQVMVENKTQNNSDTIKEPEKISESNLSNKNSSLNSLGGGDQKLKSGRMMLSKN